EKTDGTKVPVAEAVVDAYRTDIDKGKMPSTKTNRKGEFTFAGMVPGQRYVIAVSGAGIGPRVQPDVKAGMDNVTVLVTEGDGRALTEAEVRHVVAEAATTPGTNLSAEERAKQAELAKKNEEIKKKNEQIQAADSIAAKSNTEGQAALKASNWDVALAKFDEGITAVPDYVGSTPIMLAGKMIALKNLGFNQYIAGATHADAATRLAKYSAAKAEYAKALSAFDQAITILNAAPAATDPKDQANRTSIKSSLYETAIEVHRLMAVSQIDTTRVTEAEKIVNEYVAAEADAVKKGKNLTVLGDIMRNAGDFDKAIAAYKGVLEAQPENNEVMAKLGLSLVGQATTVDPPNKDQMQEGLNYMQKYADTVQILPTDSKSDQEFKQSVKDTVEYLKTEQKLKAQPAKTPTRKRT
ncbi:MAG TPA: carboxypeptidase regulatory-like domain-containing protein, partial [Pyrinomonadaceae bacterium]|nr:carboxypeptidase regulatory-like domain-containing protein [Pyrinomonadaceae bacterium]